MGFLDKILHKHKDDFGDPAFDAGLPPMQDASMPTDSSLSSTGFEQSGVPSSGVASFMEKSGDDLTGLPPFDAGDQTPSTQSSPPASFQQPTNPSSNQSHSLSGQQLAHDYMHKQSAPSSPAQPTERSSAHSLEVIDLKLDAIRSELSSISQRLEKLETKKW